MSLTNQKCQNMKFSPLTYLSEEEQAMKDLVAKLSNEKIAPLVKKMDEESKIERSVIDELFKNGVCLFA